MNESMTMLRRTFKLKNILNEQDDILKSEMYKKIFFIETHQNFERKLENPRQACSVESAARTNPEMEIYFIFVTNSSGINMEYSDLIEALLSYRNIHLRYLNPLEFSQGTVMEEFFKSDKIAASKYPLEHLSDILRMFLLNKYSGQYLDLDIFSLVPLSVINHQNFACPESVNVLTNAVINLDSKIGRNISSLYLEDVSKNYNPTSWIGNGPLMFSKAVKTFCPDTDLVMNNTTNCADFTVFPRHKCYPLTYQQWKMMYEENNKQEVFKKIKDTGSYFVHVWNRMQISGNKTYHLTATSKSAYIDLAKTYCPLVFKTVEKYF